MHEEVDLGYGQIPHVSLTPPGGGGVLGHHIGELCTQTQLPYLDINFRYLKTLLQIYSN